MLAGAAGQLAALLDQCSGALQLRRVALDQAGEIALEGHATVFCLLLTAVTVQAEQVGEAAGGAGGFLDAEQGQGLQAFGLALQGRQFALQLAGQFAAAAADQAVAGMAQAGQMTGGVEQRAAVVGGGAGVAAVGILGQLLQGAIHLSFGLQQQALRVAGELAGGEQLVGGKALQLGKAGAQVGGQRTGQLVQRLLQLAQGLDGGAMAQGVAAVQVAEDVVGHLLLELLGQRQVARHQLVGALQGALRPPQGGRQGDAHGHQQQGIEIGQGFQAHRARPMGGGRCRLPG